MMTKAYSGKAPVLPGLLSEYTGIHAAGPA